MDKTELRREIRARKRAMTEAEIEERSARLARLFFASRAYQNAKTIYGYLPYNQEVRTVPMLERALKDGKKVAVPKVYGDEMKFLYLDDLTAVAKGYAGIPEPIADEPVAHDETALVLMPGLAFDPQGHRIGAQPPHPGSLLRIPDAAQAGRGGSRHPRGHGALGISDC